MNSHSFDFEHLFENHKIQFNLCMIKTIVQRHQIFDFIAYNVKRYLFQLHQNFITQNKLILWNTNQFFYA